MDNSTEMIDRVENCDDYASAGIWCHETACVVQPSTIGQNTSIGPYTHVMAGASIGANCQIGRNVVIASKAVIGDGVFIGHNVVIEDGVRLESGVYCGAGVVLTTRARPRSERLSGKPCESAHKEDSEFIPSYLAIGRPKPIGLREVAPSCAGIDDGCPKAIVVREGATLGANATLIGGITVHDYAMVEAGAVVTNDVPRYAVMSGTPANRTGWLCRCTEKSLNFSGCVTTVCPACYRHYRMSNPGPEEYSPGEERNNHHTSSFKFLTRANKKSQPIKC